MLPFRMDSVFFIAGNSLFFYLQKIVLPFPLVACYGYTPELVITNASMYISTAICILFAIFCFIKRNSNPFLFASFTIIILSVLPVLGLVPFEYQIHSTVADHYMYFGMLGVTLLIPLFAESIKKYNYFKYIFATLFVAYLAININQTNTWKNEFTIWDNTLAHYQNSPNVYYNRGVQYSQQKNYQAAIADYTQSLTLQPNYLDALFNRANAYENSNNMSSAFADYNMYLSIDSTDGSVFYKRAYLNYKTGNISAAISDVGKSEQLNFPMAANFKNFLLKQRAAP
jgi:tetratricopeptide (TPR) repeat protein